MAASLLPSLHPSRPLLLPCSTHGFPHLSNSTRRGGRLLLPQPPPPYPRGRVVAGIGSEFADFHTAGAWAQGLFERAEGFVYTVADAAVSASSSPDVAGVVAEEGQKQGRDWLSGITDYMETVLKVLKGGLSAVHVPYSYGFAIILLTILVKAATFPLTKKQVESAMAMRLLQPQVKAIQERCQGDQERIQLETARLYKVAGVNPLAGCLPTLATIPVWIGLYRALSNVANEGLLTEGFFWIPSLAGPTAIATRQSGSGVSWLFPFSDGHPPLGWHDTLAYLVLPVLLVISQYISAQIMQPSPQGDDPTQKNAQTITKFLPLMIGYFSLSVPSGLSLYWFTNNLLSMAQQIWLQKLGGAKNPVKDYNIGSTDTISSIQTGLDVDLRNENSAQAKSVPKLDVTRESPTPAKLGSGGLRPGERFKMIKEQEARGRQEREEEKRKAEEAASGSLSSTMPDKAKLRSIDSGLQVNEYSSLQESSSSFTVDADGSKYESPVHDLSRFGAASVNHSHAIQDSKDGKTGDILSLATGETEACSSNSNLTNERAGEWREKVSEKD